MLNFYIKTYGCQMNERDSESLACLLEARGYCAVEEETAADILIFNTCSVRDQAERKVIGKIGMMKKLKDEKPSLVIGVIGCMAQRLGAKILEELPQVDFVAGTDQLQKVPNLIEEAVTRHGRSAALEMGPEVFRELDGHRPGRLIAEISVMRGCDQFCTYCVVPYCRGREKSRPIEAIVDEAERLVAGGTKELLLLGQNITAYGVAEARKAGTYTPEFSAFADLLVALNEVKGIERIRFTSPHVHFMNDKFVEAVTQLPKVCKCFHVPVQSGNDRILKLMHRNYTAKEYLSRIDAIRAKAPETLFSTDIIVGFCSETRQEFEDTHEVMRRVGYDMAYIFRYSQRSGTRAAATLKDDVSEAEKHERNQILLQELNESVARHNAQMVGTTVPVLIEGPSPRNSKRWCGRSDRNKMVLFDAIPELKVGEIRNFRVERSTENALYGILDKS